MANKIILDKQELYEKYKVLHWSQRRLAQYYNCSIDTIVRNLQDYNIASNTNSDYISPPITLTSIQKEALYGALLGDGSLAKHKDSINTCLSYCSKSRQHVEFVAHYFEQYLTLSGIRQRSTFDIRTNKTYVGFCFRTITNSAFEQERKRWYQERKIIPSDLVLTPLICLIWYIGDGCICKTSRSEYIKLSTHCFSKTELEQILLPQLSCFDACLIKCGISKDGQQQYSIKIPRDKIASFLAYIGPCPFDDYVYKWITKKYINAQPTDHTALEDKFCELYLAGQSYYAIAKQFNIEPAAVRHYLVKRKIYKTPLRYKNAVVAIDKKSGEYVACYLSMHKAGEQLHLSDGYISMCCNGSRNHAQYKFVKLSQLSLHEQRVVFAQFNMKGEYT